MERIWIIGEELRGLVSYTLFCLQNKRTRGGGAKSAQWLKLRMGNGLDQRRRTGGFGYLYTDLLAE